MDNHHFDALTRSISRRDGLGLLSLFGVGLALHPGEGEAKKKTCKPKCKACRMCIKGKCKAEANGTLCPGGVCQQKRCIPVLQICADGVKNGNESAVDCGGSCPRCGNGNACNNRNDCDSAFCKPGVKQCQVCLTNADCPRDDAGGCQCEITTTGGTCLKNVAESLGSASCPNGQVAIPVNGGFSCFKRCGA